MDIREIEDLIKNLKSVINCRILLNENDIIKEVHIVANESRSAKQISRDIQSIIATVYGMELDYKKISIAQVKDSTQNQDDRRLRIKSAVLLFLGPLLLARFTFKQYTDLRETYLDTIKAFNKLTEAKDTYTGEHASRVETYAVELARYINLPENRIENIRMAALLHDIGKIGISDLVLKKTSALTDSEYEQIKQHPTIGADIIHNVHFLKDVSTIIRHHHERYDGRGYPDHLVGEKISTESAILSLADVYDAITSNRSYRTPLMLEDAIYEITKNSGTQFNPKLTEKFAELILRKREVFDRSVS